MGKPSFIFGGINEEDTAHYNIAVGVCLGLVSAICAAAQYTIVNYIKDDCHWLQIEHTSAALSTFILCPVGVLAFSIYDYQVNGHVFSIKFDNLTAGTLDERESFEIQNHFKFLNEIVFTEFMID